MFASKRLVCSSSSYERKMVLFMGFVALFQFLLSVNGRSDIGYFRESYLHTKENHVLLGHVFQRRQTGSILSCAQACLSYSQCKSFFYDRSVTNHGICELKNYAPLEGIHSNELIFLEGATYGIWFRTPAVAVFTFTTLGATGRSGPLGTSGYSGTFLRGRVKLQEGIQLWEVPVSGNYAIEALGASGANGSCVGCEGWRIGGRGARIRGVFELRAGQQLKILVGQEGLGNELFNERPGGGGGGSFVTFTDNRPLIVAGGGGGGATTLQGSKDGDPGQTSHNGTRHGGAFGLGGELYDYRGKDALSSSFICGSGAGLHGDGEAANGDVALSFERGGTGGVGPSSGGFGGGGFGLTNPGGGGGYSGGGVLSMRNMTGAAGGEGSYNNGTSQVNESGVNVGGGQVIITLSD